MTRVYSKDPTTPRATASFTKIATGLLARQWVPDVDLDDSVTVTSADSPAGPGGGGVANGDIVTYRDLFYLMFMTSRDDCTHCLARNVGALIIAGTGPGTSSDPYDRFVEALNIETVALGATTAYFEDATGFDDDNRLSVSDVALLGSIMETDAFLVTAAGTYSRPVTTLNGSPRTFDCINLFDPTGAATVDVRIVTGYAFPEHVASKYGITTAAGYCLMLIWDTPSDGRRVTVVMNSGNDTQLKRDLRRMLNYELARAA